MTQVETGFGIDETHDQGTVCWVESANDHPHFPIQNLPLGRFLDSGNVVKLGVAIGSSILDVTAGIASGRIDGSALSNDARDQIERGEGAVSLLSADRRNLRHAVFSFLKSNNVPEIDSNTRELILDAQSVTILLPINVAGYTDFFAGIHHARKAGVMFRPDNPLLPNYKYVPVGYHGRASSVGVSPVIVDRPLGQVLLEGSLDPIVQPTAKLDYEFELAIWIGRTDAATNIGVASDAIAGYGILNDWSSRDVQRWEAVPLGPFLAKSFATTVTPWVITPEALAPFRKAQPERPEGDPKPLAYLLDPEDQAHGALGATLEVAIRTSAMRSAELAPVPVSHASALDLYWTPAQLVTHHMMNGCQLGPGDLLGTGTVSAEHEDGGGCLLELTEDGRRPIALAAGVERTFLQDGDEVTLRAKCESDGYRSIGFGDCVGTIAVSGQ